MSRQPWKKPAEPVWDSLSRYQTVLLYELERGAEPWLGDLRDSEVAGLITMGLVELKGPSLTLTEYGLSVVQPPWMAEAILLSMAENAESEEV